jgi:hypothetical protein
MIYSTLKEVYNVDSFEKEKKKKKKSKYDEELFNEEQANLSDNAKNLYAPPNTTSPCITTETLKPVYKASMNNVKPFLDEDLEQYLNVDDMPRPTVKKVEQVLHAAEVPQEAKQEIKEEKSSQPSPSSQPSIASPPHLNAVPVQQVASDKDIFYKNLINIALFVFIGILVLFLCDQITEIAINIGMKKTVAILEPYLERYKRDLE